MTSIWSRPDPVTANNGSINYTYDAVGNRLNRTSTVAAIPTATSTFNTNDQLGGDTYDSNGNTATSAGKTYVYDFENRIKSVNSGQIVFVYDGDGNRVSKTVGGVTTKFLVDTSSPTGYAQVVEEIIASNVQRVYEHGHLLISQTQLIGGNWVTSFYGYDGHGSVRFLTDTTRAITDTYTYDAFGNAIASTGTTPNNYLYAGEQLDTNLGFYYLRARYMNPSSGRFWTMDSFDGSTSDPATLHKYLYASADGVNRSDPSGNFSIVEAMITVAVIAIVAAIPACRQPQLRRPRSVAFQWRVPEEEWWYSFSQGIRLTGGEIAEIKLRTIEAFKQAFAGFAVNVSDGAFTNEILIQERDASDPTGTLGATQASTRSFVYLEAARVNAIARGAEAKPPIRDKGAVVSAIGIGLGRTAAHEFWHQISIEAGRQAPHSQNPNELTWGTRNGVKELIPWELYYGNQTWPPEAKDFLKTRIPYEE